MLTINGILKSFETEEDYRVLWISVEDDIIFMINLSDNSFPVSIKITVLEKQIQEGAWAIEKKDKYVKAVSEELISKRDKAFRDNIWNHISEFTKNEPAIYDRALRGKMIRTAAVKTGLTHTTLYKYLKWYWHRGKNKNAYLPNYQNSGGKGKERTAGDKKLGRPRKYANIVGKNVDKETQSIFEKSIKRFYHTRKELSFQAAYDMMVKEYYTNKIELEDGNIQFQVKSAEEIPTIGQFRYWYSKKYNAKDKQASRKGEAQYNLNHRAILGKSDTNIRGPGSQYQIDATIGDIYLVSRFNRANIIGRPVVYFIIDVFSRMITGMYVGLEGPSWTGSMMALANAATDKAAFCEAYGISISEEQWPCRHIPDTILADRGEMESKSVETLINSLNIRVDNAPAYRADMKGIVERLFKSVNMKTMVFLPGYVKSDMAKRGGKDYRLDAKLDIYQFTKIIVQSVLNHNNYHYLANYERSVDMIADDIEPIPLKLWNWGINHRSGILRSVSEDAVKLCLMPSDTALVTAKGIKFQNLYYLSERAVSGNWFETARAKGSYRVNISYDPRDMSNIYVRDIDGALFEKCYLSEWQNKWHGKTLDEVLHQQVSEKELTAKNSKRELQARVDLSVEIDKIVKEAEDMAKQTVIPLSKSERISNIRENRAAEKEIIRKDEAFVLGKEEDILQNDISEKDESQDGQMHPILAMIKKKAEERLNEQW